MDFYERQKIRAEAEEILSAERVLTLLGETHDYHAVAKEVREKGFEDLAVRLERADEPDYTKWKHW